jgi:hypothetical protein
MLYFGDLSVSVGPKSGLRAHHLGCLSANPDAFHVPTHRKELLEHSEALQGAVARVTCSARRPLFSVFGQLE